MGRTITVNGQGYTSHWRQYESKWTQRAHMGESAQSEFVFDDDNNDLDHANLAARKIIEVWDDASGASKCLYSGRVMNKSLRRGDKSTGNAMRWVVTAEDRNVDLKGIRITDSVRPSESDRERVLAFMAGYLDGAASTNAHHRNSTDLAGTYVINTALVTMPAETYTDTFPLDVFGRISEISAKNFFVTIADDGTLILFYAPFTDTTYASTISLTDVLADVDNVNVFAPFYESVSGEHEGQTLISGGGVRYGADQFYEASNIGSSEADHDKWEEHFQDDYINTASDAATFLNNVVASRNNENFSFIVTIQMTDAQAHRIRAGMTLSYRMAATDVQTPVTYRAVQVQHQPYGPGITDVTIELGWPRGRPFQRHIRTKPGPFPPAQPTAGNAIRLYHSSHTAGSGSTAESLASPNLAVGNLAAGWEYNAGGGFEYYQAYRAPASSSSAEASWSATGAAAGQAAIRGYVAKIDTDLLDIVQGGGTVRMQARARARYGIGISESSQNHTSYWTLRVYRPGTGFVATLVAMSSAGSTNWPAQATQLNRSWTGTLTAYASAVATDYLVFDLGADHVAPTSGGTGAAILFTDTSASDLPQDLISSATYNSWIEFTGTGSTGDTTSPITNPGEASPGSGTTYSPINHEHDHGFLADDGTHMHDEWQVVQMHTNSGSDPTVTNDADTGYSRGWTWNNTTSGDQFILADSTPGAAVWQKFYPGGSGAPTTADYLVGTAQAGLSAEIVVGTSPGGELGGTWASPTVDSTHAGSDHNQPVRKNSTGSVFTRRQLNFIEGSNVTLTVADDAGNDEVDITIASTGGGLTDHNHTAGGDGGDLTAAVVSNYVDFTHIANPATPSAATGRLSATTGTGERPRWTDDTGAHQYLWGVTDSSDIPDTGDIIIATAGSAVIEWRKPLHIGARAYETATQNITNNTQTAVTFTSEEYDTSTIHSTASNTSRFTIPTGYSGIWLLKGQAFFQANATGIRNGYFRKNGSTDIIGSAFRTLSPGSTGGISVTPMAVVELAAGDYIEMMVEQNSGVTLTVGHATIDPIRSMVEMVFMGT